MQSSQGVGSAAVGGQPLMPIKNPFPNGKVITTSIYREEEDELYDYGLSLNNHMETLVNNGKAASFLFEFLDDPKQYLVLISVLSKTVYFPPFIHECACNNATYYNRFLAPRREELEERLLKDTVSLYQKQETLRYLCMGSGGCLQDFINLGKLIKEGYQKIEATFVDPENKIVSPDLDRRNYEYRKEKELQFQGLKEQMSFLSAAAAELGAELTMSFVSHIDEAEGTFQIVQLIDFDVFNEAFGDLMRSHERLHEKGRFYLSFDEYDVIFSKTECIYKKVHTPFEDKLNPFLKNILTDLKVRNTAKPQIAMWTIKHRDESWMELFPRLCQNPAIKEVALTTLHPRELDNHSIPLEDKANEQFTPENLSRFLSLICNKTVRVDFCQNEEQFLGRLSSEYDFVSYLFDTDEEQTIYHRVGMIREQVISGNLFFAIAGFKVQYSPLSFDAVWGYAPEMGVTIYGSSSEDSSKKVLELMDLPMP